MSFPKKETEVSTAENAPKVDPEVDKQIEEIKQAILNEEKEEKGKK
jgi:hypothetical protein